MLPWCSVMAKQPPCQSASMPVSSSSNPWWTSASGVVHGVLKHHKPMPCAALVYRFNDLGLVWMQLDLHQPICVGVDWSGT